MEKDRSFEQSRSDLSDVGSFHTSLGITRDVHPSPAGSKDAGRTVLKCSRVKGSDYVFWDARLTLADETLRDARWRVSTLFDTSQTTTRP